MFECLGMCILMSLVPAFMKLAVLFMKFMLTHFPNFDDLKGDDEDDPES